MRTRGEAMDLLRWKWLWIVPTLLFLGSALFAIYKGTPGEWHTRCIEFWKNKNWMEIRSLAENLQTLNKPDAEVLFYAAAASKEMKDEEGFRRFAVELLDHKTINWNWETQLAAQYESLSFLEAARMYRSRAVLSLLPLILILHTLYLWRRRPALHWSAAICCIGIVFVWI